MSLSLSYFFWIKKIMGSQHPLFFHHGYWCFVNITFSHYHVTQCTTLFICFTKFGYFITNLHLVIYTGVNSSEIEMTFFAPWKGFVVLKDKYGGRLNYPSIHHVLISYVMTITSIDSFTDICWSDNALYHDNLLLVSYRVCYLTLLLQPLI